MPPRILLVDDEPLIRWAIRETLANAGCEVVEAGDARTALSALNTTPTFDLILLDCHLPDCNGLELLSVARALSPSSQSAIMTAFMPDGGMDRAHALGVIGVLSKPFDMTEVDALV